LFAYNLRFPGQYFDAESGKHYNYFRDYDPAIGRYVESDPIGLKASLNTYAYSSSTPLVSFDPWGLCDNCGDAAKSAGGVGNGKNYPDYDPPLENVYPELFALGAAGARGAAAATAEAAAAIRQMARTCANIRCKAPEVHDAHHTFGGKKMCHLQLNCWIKGVGGSGFVIRIPYPCDGGAPPGFNDRR